MTDMRRATVHRSLYRRILVLGAERDLVLLSGSIVAVLALGGRSALSIGAAVLVWFCSLYAFQRMGKADPYMSKVVSRHLKQQEFYDARSTPWRGM